MDLPLSGNQLKKLTKRYRDGTLQPGDQELLDDVLRCYAVVLHQAHQEVEQLCGELPNAQPMAPRVKTRKTTLEKLHRQPHLHSITQIRDLAGLRVIVEGPRADQDDVAGRLTAHFGEGDRPVKRIDRRADPRQGYRAVHLEVEHSGLKVEVQIRTDLQHAWAELYESLADRLGRGIRYGEAVELGTVERRLVDTMSAYSDTIDVYERLSPEHAHRAPRLRAAIEQALRVIDGIVADLP